MKKLPGNGNFRVGILHNSFDGAATFSNNSSYEVIMRQDLERHFPVKIKIIRIN